MLIDHLVFSIENAGNNFLIKDIDISGLTSQLIQGMLNNLLSKDWVSYLEVGVWQGSTFVAALYQNSPKFAVAIDNFCEQFPHTGDKSSSDIFLSNCARYTDYNFLFLKEDCFTIDKSLLTPINVYFYDGGHSETEQYQALEYYMDILENQFIFIVDDWNWPRVKAGTKKAIKELNLKVDYATELPARFNGDRLQWWNGIYAAVISKPMALVP